MIVNVQCLENIQQSVFLLWLDKGCVRSIIIIITYFYIFYSMILFKDRKGFPWVVIKAFLSSIYKYNILQLGVYTLPTNYTHSL